jgi:hypothetical protein
MRTFIFLALGLYSAISHVSAQHPLVGTWEMISAKGIDADGESFYLDTTAVKETKIITPTHYMLIAWDVEQDSLIFNRTMAGKVRMEGEKYIETPTQASVQIFDNVNANFTWKLDGDIFTQSGTIVRPDGKTVVLEALLFRRVRNVKSNPANPAIGAWKQLSADYTLADGKRNPSFNDSDQSLLIVTPTHWMRMNHKNKKFHGAQYGRYQMKGKDVITDLSYSTYGEKKGEQPPIAQEISGDQINFTLSGKTAGGQRATFHQLFERIR